MSGDKFDQLYNALKADGAVSGTRENFKKFVYAPGKQGYQNRKRLYEALHADGAVSSGSYEEFAQRLGLHAVKPQKQAQAPQQSAYKPQTAAQMAMSMAQPQQSQEPVDYLSRPQSQRGKALGGAPKNASPFVQSLYEEDNAKKGADYPVSYSSPKGVQQVYEQNKRVRKEATKTAADKIANDYWREQNRPIIENGTVGVMKTQKQLADDMYASAEDFVKNENNGTNFIDDIINQEIFTESQKRADAAYRKGNWHINPAGDEWDELAHSREANKEFDQDKMIKDSEKLVKERVQEWISNPKTLSKIMSEADKLGVSAEDYVKNSITPALYNKIAEQLPVENLKRYLPKGRFDFIMGGLTDGVLGTLGALGNQTKSQRQLKQEAIQMTKEHKNPNFDPTVWDNAGRGAVSFASDAPLYSAAGVGSGAITEKIFGNGLLQTARMANANMARRVLTGVAKGAVHGYATGFQYGAVSGAVQNFSTGEDTSLGGTLKAAMLGGLEEGASFATMEAMGGAVGGLGHKIGLNGAEISKSARRNHIGQKLTFEALKTGMEGIGMATGGVASSYANHILTGEDWKGFTVEDTLESCASAVIFKLTHAKDLFKREVDSKTGKQLGIGDSLAMKAARFLSSDAAKSQRFVFTDEEKHQLFNAGSEAGVSPVKDIFDLAKKAKNTNPEDMERGEDGSDVLTYYQQIMQDPNVSWDAKAKFSTFVMGTMPESRPMYDHYAVGTEEGTDNDNTIHTYNVISEYAADGTLLSKRRYDTRDKRESIIYELKMRGEGARLDNAKALLIAQDRNNYDLQNAFFKENAKDWEQVEEILNGMQTEGSAIDHNFTQFVMNAENGRFMQTVDAVAKQSGMKREDILNALDKEPLKRTDAEQNACIQLRHALEDVAFPKDKVHEEQSHLQGKDVAEDNGLGTEKPNGEAVKQELNNLSEAENELEQFIKDNDVFGQNFENLQKQGLTNPQIYAWMLDNGLMQEQLAPFAHYINANARVQGMQNATQQKIEERVSAYVQDWSHHGTLNGQEAKGEQVVYVQDKDGRTLVVGSGDMAFDSTNGRPKEGVGDMLVCLDPNTGDIVYTKVDDVTFFQTQKPEDFGKEYRNKLQQINSQAYNEAAAEQAAKNENNEMNQSASVAQSEKSVPLGDSNSSTTTDSQGALHGINSPDSHGKDTNNSSNGNGSEATLTFKDGNPVPMTTDSKGRPTPDYGKMTAEQAADVMTQQFGEDAEKVADAQIKKAEKALKDAEKMKVNYNAEPNDILEQKQIKETTIAAAKEQLEKAQGVKKALTAQKVAETMKPKETESVGTNNEANTASSTVAAKFQNATRLQGRTRTRTLSDKTKIRGHYEIVPAESLTPSHDVLNGYKKSEGFPVDAEGRTINDRDYENDKKAQEDTNLAASKYDGQAIDHIPTVSDEGIVYDGNGRTMAGQKAAKDGTDGEYLNALYENAEMYGFTKEQIEQSGIEHPRLVLVTDERLPYDTATFAKFNRNERKTQSNTEKAVTRAKTLSSDEVGSIVAEVEGSGLLEAFFKNPKAINDLINTLQEKGVLAHNEIAELLDGEGVLSAQGKEYVKNLLLGSVFTPDTIRMMGIDSAIKTKAVSGIRAIMDNMKLGDYALRDELDNAIKLLYEARNNGMTVEDLLRQGSAFEENARDRFSPIEQAIAQSLEGSGTTLFRDLMREYNEIAKNYNTGEADMFGEHLSPEELVKQFLEVSNTIKNNDIKLYGNETRHSEQEGGNHAASNEEPAKEAGRAVGTEGSEPTESQVRVTEALKHIATEITKQTGVEVVTDDKYKAQGMGLIARRKEIAKEIGTTEAAKIDKPWSEMDGEERMATAEKQPLTEDEIRNNTSEENQDLIEDAIDYLNGNHGFAQQLAYLKIYDDVRNRHEDAPDNSGAGDGTQLAATDNGGGEGLGLGTGRDSRGADEQLDRGTGDEPSSRERTSGEGDKADPATPAGEPSDKQGEGNTPDMGAVPARDTDTKGGSADGTDGNKPKRGGRKSSNRPAKPDAKRKPTAKQGTTWRNRTEAEIKQEAKDAKAGLKAALAEIMKRGRGEASLSLVGLNSKQIEYVPELMKAVKRYGMSLIDQGIYKIKDWMSNIREGIHDEMKAIGFSDKDIDDFIEEMWNSKMTMDGETHTISEWSSIYGNAQLRKKLGDELEVKRQKQMAAEPIEVKVGDRKNIEETLPFLLPQQQEDVLRAETQFFGNEHSDRDHAYGKGYMFTNGTGTGKTYTGLGIAKRLAKQGKGRILFVTPSQPKVKDWIKDAKNLGLDIRDLDAVAKEKGTAATTESGEGMVITTYANMRQNKKLLETEWDAVIYDESHRIMENKKGAETTGSQQHYLLTNRDENHAFLRLQSINKHYQKMQSALDKFNTQRQKEIERIRKEYKQSHPVATKEDIAHGVQGKLPKDIYSFAPADGMTFPELGKAYQDFTAAKAHYYNNVEPKLKEQAKQTWKNTKTVFLSATPFNTRENLDYAEGYIFKFPEEDMNSGIGKRSRFYLDHFGAAYRYRYNRLEAKTDNPDAVAKQEVAFSDYLQNTLGTMSGRIIDSPYDYSRDFPTVAPDHAEDFNNATQEAMTGRYLGEAYRKTIGNYNYGSALFETMKIANIIERMKEHLDAGRKIVVFHRRVETKEPLQAPFAYMLSYANAMIKDMKPGKEKEEAIAEANEFRRKYADLLQWEQTLDYSMPREQIAKAFGKDNVLFFSGKESKGAKSKAVDTFNDDNSGKNIIVIQEASGKEGISLHDTTGNHQRVLITLALPQSPITALQVEGRTYRIGNKSNAIFEYPILGLNSEMMLFGEKFNNQVSTTENLALGSQARSLRESFANGVLEHSGIVPIDQQGVGGKEFDAPKQSNSDPFDDAVLDYYSNQKLNKRNREGVDYFPTPEPLGYKMVEWANMGEGDTALEPSAGHGAIARYIPRENQLLSIEPSQSLFTKLQLKAGGLGRKFLNNMFENYDVSNKHDVVVMNPPFGTAGATAIAHLDKAFKHLDEGGRVVAIIPRGSTDKKFDKWYDGQKNIAMRAEVDLPDIVFQQAGTSVRCRVVVLDKITDAALRDKAGYPEKIDLSGHYDKIEDFFEDLRDVRIPNRIIDTQLKDMKKARTFKKELEGIKGIQVNYLDRNGISVFDKNTYRDYSINFSEGSHSKEWLKEKYSAKYNEFDQAQNRAYNENSKAALEEMKKLACKLADMSEDEMQKYISDRKNGGTHFREDRGVQYSKTDAKDVKKGRIIPEDVDKSVSSQIEKKFDDEIEKIKSEVSDGDLSKFENDVEYYLHESSSVISSRETLKYLIKSLENDEKRYNAGLSRAAGLEGNSGENNQQRKSPYILSRNRAAIAAYRRELVYREARIEAIRNRLGVQSVGENALSALARYYKGSNQGRNAETDVLFNKALDIVKRLGVEFSVHEEGSYARNPNVEGLSDGVNRNIDLFLESMARTMNKGNDLTHTILHEMIHQATVGSINLVKKGKAEGVLTPKQIEAVNDILDIYDKVKDDKERFKENPYGLKDAYELTAQMADPRQRKAMDLSIWDRVVNAAHEFARKGDRSVLERLKDAVKKLFEVSDKDKMDKAINDIMDDFNETVDDISMNEIEKDGFASSAVKLSDKAPIVVKHIADVAKKVGGKVNMVQSVGEITNKRAKAAIEAGKPVTGWYDEKTGEVHLYMSNIHDRYTAEKTIWHEVVGHKGMRELFGEDRFDKFLRSIWYDLDKPENASLKKLVDEERRKNPLNIYDAIEEGVARLAEEGRGDAGFWQNIKNKVTDFLHEIGYRVAPNTKDVKYLLWLSKNLQKNPNDPYYKMRAEAVKYHIDHEDVPAVTERDGMFHDNTGRVYHDMSELPKAEYQEMTDGKVHFRTTPSAGTALDRYDRALNAHGYMATESFMDNMLSLKELMKAVDPSIKKIEDVKSSENPYMLQNTMQGAMSDAAQMFERNVMKPLDKAMADVLDAFEGKKDNDKIRNFNLYMITKHGLERNRVFFVRDYIGSMEKADAEILQKQWDAEKKDLGDKLRNGQIRLDEYYKDMDEWIRNNVDKDFDASEHDYSGMHGVQEIADTKAPYDDAAAIQSVMDSEASMESTKAGSVKDFWSKVNKATSYSLYCDYANGFQSRETYTKTSQMFDWYVPLRKFDETTAEDVYGYVTEKGDPSGYIGSVLMSAKGRKSLSEVNVLAQIGAMGNMAINNGGKNAIKQAFMRFARSHNSEGLITEGQVWLVKDGTNADGSDRWVEAYPQIPDGADPNTTSTIINKFEADMKAKQAKGDAKIMRNAAEIGYKFERAKDKSQHVVDVKVNGKTHRFYINGNPRAAQALNGMLENKGWTPVKKTIAPITRTMAQLCTSFSPEFVVRNIVRDAQFASSNVTAKEGARYGAKWAEYYAKMLPIGAKNISIGDIKGSTGLGLYAKYRNGTLDMNNKIHKYFKEFMENGGETGWVQVLSMKEWEKKYKRDIKTERSKLDKGGKAIKDFFFGNLENLNEAAENMARFATYCTSRDYGRSAVRSAYDAKEVSTNFNRHGSGDSVWSFKNGEMSGFEKARRNTYGFVASYLRQCSMFFNAGIQSTNLLKQNVKAAPKGTITAMMALPFGLGVGAALLNNWMIANEDEKDRNGVKDPYAELPDHIRRNNLCIYKGGGEFIIIPLAIELRAFYGLGDLAAGMTFANNIKSTREPWMDAVGCVSQLVPVMDYTNSHAVDKDPINETVKAFSPSAISPFVEWGLNSDWKGAPIRRETTSYNEYAPAWQRAYKNTPEFFMQLNKKVNAATNDVAPGSEDMLGNGFLDAVTNPAGLNHYLGGFGGGAATFATRISKLATADKAETNDIPFLRSFLYKPNEQSSMQRTKSKWYNYVEGMEKTMSNLDRLKSKNVPIDKRLENVAAYYTFKDSKEAQMADIIERAQKYMKKWKQMRDKSSDATAIDNANKNIDLIMQEAVEQLDKLQ